MARRCSSPPRLPSNRGSRSGSRAKASKTGMQPPRIEAVSSQSIFSSPAKLGCGTESIGIPFGGSRGGGRGIRGGIQHPFQVRVEAVKPAAGRKRLGRGIGEPASLRGEGGYGEQQFKLRGFDAAAQCFCGRKRYGGCGQYFSGIHRLPGHVQGAYDRVVVQQCPGDGVHTPVVRQGAVVSVDEAERGEVENACGDRKSTRLNYSQPSTS